MAERVLEYIDRDFDNDGFTQYEQQETEAFQPLEYIVEIAIHPSCSDDVEHVDVQLSFQMNGRRAGWLIAQNLDCEEALELVRSGQFARSLFSEVKNLLQTKLELTTPPHSQPKFAREFAEKEARKKELRLKQQLEVKRPGRRPRATSIDRAALLGQYRKRLQAIADNQGLPSWVRNRLAKRGHEEPWKIALIWAAKELGLKYRSSYLPKVLTHAINESLPSARAKDI